MTYEALRQAITTPIFTSEQVGLAFPAQAPAKINLSLSRLVRQKRLRRLKRGLYAFSTESPDEFVVANQLYPPSYISLETALNSYGVIPEVSAAVTSVSPTTAKKITAGSVFFYSKIAPTLFFGWRLTKSATTDFYYKIALPEKALLDYIYIRRLRSLASQRVDLSKLDRTRLNRWAKAYPLWVKKAYEQYRH